MVRILILYGTTDGHTAKVAKSIAGTIAAQGAEVAIVDAGSADPRPGDFDGIVVAASVHAGGYQRPVRSWISRHLSELGQRPTAFVSVCLGVLQREPKVQQELDAILSRFETSSGWHPGETKIVAGALPYTHYNWIKRWMMKRIVRKAGGETDTTRDYEYTDWEDLRRFAAQFVQRVADATRKTPGRGPHFSEVA